MKLQGKITAQKHSSIKVRPIQACLRKKKDSLYTKVLNKRMKLKPKTKLETCLGLRTERKFFTGDSKHWSHKLYTITEFINDTERTGRKN